MNTGRIAWKIWRAYLLTGAVRLSFSAFSKLSLNVSAMALVKALPPIMMHRCQTPEAVQTTRSVLSAPMLMITVARLSELARSGRSNSR